MPKKIALDYDDSELRIVVANCNSSRVQVTDARVIPIAENESVSEKLRAYITGAGLQKTETLVAIGRGKAELRELQLPPVPVEELPDMVRFQALRSFAAASDRSIVDFLVTGRTAEHNTLIAATVSPVDLDRVRELCSTSELILKRVALRPLTAASLYLKQSKPPQICVLIDLLADDAEIVIARDGNVIFVRTVRLPPGDAHRSGAIAGELRRTMVACGETETPGRIIVWGTESVHAGDLAAIKKASGCEDVQAVNPFDLVDMQMDRSALPDHIGRLAPLVGLLSSDENAPETLIDFLNPRERVEAETNRLRQVLMIAGPIAAVLLVGFLFYRQFASWDRKIAAVNDEIQLLVPSGEAADESLARTELIDKFMDSDVNWLDEIRRFAIKAPPSDKLIVETLYASANVNTRDSNGGGTLRVTGLVTDTDVIDTMEAALRDETHGVVGKGSQAQKSEDAYRWDFTETIVINGSDLRSIRYRRMAEHQSAEPAGTDAEPSDLEKASAMEQIEAVEEQAEQTESASDGPAQETSKPESESELPATETPADETSDTTEQPAASTEDAA
ncbi:hypothetical protein NHH03_09535 [Stieleria sp. TO1_6]|uniref:type IV pilus biogenesis protein PilM n=1 Tax=Stieleria tagensis TaxID=2956795 RepID=UPI00209B16B1|nr:hypothetical protein [Stieleria tagensis]MCO8121977.1 hypothetical protein [Stieleria tagensis]